MPKFKITPLVKKQIQQLITGHGLWEKTDFKRKKVLSLNEIMKDENKKFYDLSLVDGKLPDQQFYFFTIGEGEAVNHGKRMERAFKSGGVDAVDKYIKTEVAKQNAIIKQYADEEKELEALIENLPTNEAKNDIEANIPTM